ncbi:MAG: hypothetical protein QM757_16485 [Paludibaculum sp.]
MLNAAELRKWHEASSNAKTFKEAATAEHNLSLILECGIEEIIAALEFRDSAPTVHAQAAALRCAQIADAMPHRKGYSVAELIRKEFGLKRPAELPIDKWRRGGV